MEYKKALSIGITLIVIIIIFLTIKRMLEKKEEAIERRTNENRIRKTGVVMIVASCVNNNFAWVYPL
ncbi:MAG: hypothetical protein ACLUR5_03300 [Eubacterium ventriosum]